MNLRNGLAFRFPAAAYDVVAAALITAALIVALRTSGDLPGAFDPDHFRDIAQAQTTRDGHPLGDPYYRDEWIWYNPLLAWVLAAGSAATGMSVEAFHIHAGPWLNLLGPITFYLLGTRLIGRRGALGALTIYLFFLPGSEHSWATATYSPWLFSGNFAQGLFFGSLLILLWAAEQPSAVRAAIAGAAIGLTFLAHTAPALILAVVACGLLWTRWRALTMAGAAAIVVASPFLVAIVWHYKLHVVNAEPLTYVYPPVSRAGLGQTIRSHALMVALAAAGLWQVRSRVVWGWLAGSAGLTASTIAGATPIVPAFHFWLYVTALIALLAGRSLARICRPALLFVAVAIASVMWNWRPYTERADLQGGRFLGARRMADHIEAAALLRRTTLTGDIVLGNASVVRLIIGPAGRKTVAADPLFSNPYVSYPDRAADRDRMLAALKIRDVAAFRDTARRRDVSAVVLTGHDDCDAAAQMFPLTWRTTDVCISVVKP